MNFSLDNLRNKLHLDVWQGYEYDLIICLLGLILQKQFLLVAQLKSSSKNVANSH